MGINVTELNFKDVFLFKPKDVWKVFLSEVFGAVIIWNIGKKKKQYEICVIDILSEDMKIRY